MSKVVMDVFISWAPMIVLIAVWIYFMKRSGALRQSGNLELMNELLREQLAEVRKLNGNLDRIAVAIEKAGPGK